MQQKVKLENQRIQSLRCSKEPHKDEVEVRKDNSEIQASEAFAREGPRCREGRQTASLPAEQNFIHAEGQQVLEGHFDKFRHEGEWVLHESIYAEGHRLAKT